MKNITIEEGGTPFNFSVDELKTKKVNSGSLNWVPKEETRLTTKRITKDGTYTAADEGYYGYSQVSVTGIGKAVGKKDGDEYVVQTDTGGNLVETKVPSSIVVTTPPTKISYSDGEPIDLAGAVITAMLASGDVWSDAAHPSGQIPISELTIQPATADISKAGEGYASDIVPIPINTAGTGGGIDPDETHYVLTFSSAGALTHIGGGGTYTCIFASTQSGSKAFWTDVGTGETKFTYNLTSAYTRNGQTVYYNAITGPAISVTPLSNNDINQYSPGEIAWTMVYGQDMGYVLPVNLAWARPGDGKILETYIWFGMTQ